MNVIGVDIALRNSGFAIFDTAKNKFIHYSVMKYGGPLSKFSYDEINDLNKFIGSYIDNSIIPYSDIRQPYIFVVEGTTRSGHYNTSLKLMVARLGVFSHINSIEKAAKLNIDDVLSPVVQDWKSELLGKSNLSKLDTKDWLMERKTKFGIPIGLYADFDTIDAACLAIYGMVKKSLKTKNG